MDNKKCNSEVVSNVRLKATKGAAVPAGPAQAWINTVELPVSSVMLTGAMPAGMGTPTRTPLPGHPLQRELFRRLPALRHGGDRQGGRACSGGRGSRPARERRDPHRIPAGVFRALLHPGGGHGARGHQQAAKKKQ